MFPGDWPKTGSRRSAVLRFAITNGPRAAKIEWNSFPEHCFPAGAIFFMLIPAD
jgi:hypothetical protein